MSHRIRYLRIQEDRYGNRTIEAVVIQPTTHDVQPQIEGKEEKTPKSTPKLDWVLHLLIPCSMGILLGWHII